MANTPMQGVMPLDVDVQTVQAARHCSARQRLKKGGKGGDPDGSLVGTAFATFSTFGWLAWTDQASGVLSRPGLHGGE